MSSSQCNLTLHDAETLADKLTSIWGEPGAAMEVVGSVRRKRSTVHDLEFIAPLPEDGQPDPLCGQLIRTLKQHSAKDLQQSLFAPAAPVNESHIGKAIKGLMLGFKAVYLEVWPTSGLVVPVQIFRYTQQNRGWIELMRTGPTDFGRMFLSRWKTVHGISQSTEARASIDGHLVDRYGAIVPVDTESEAFRKCEMAYVPPQLRDVLMSRADLIRKEALS